MSKEFGNLGGGYFEASPDEGEGNDPLIGAFTSAIEKATQKITTAIGKSAGGGGESGAGALEKITKQMSSSKFRKTTKNLKGAFGKMGAATPQMMLMNKLMGVLSGILEPFMPILYVIGGLLERMMAEIIKPMMPAIQSIIDVLLSLMPVFAVIGQVIGKYLAPLLEWLADIFEWLVGLLFGQSPGLIPAFNIVIGLIEEIVKLIFDSLMKPIEWTIGAIETIARVIGEVLIVAFESLEGIINTISEIIEGFGNFIESVLTKAFELINNIIDVIGDVAEIIGNVLEAAFRSIAWMAYYVADAIVVVINTVISAINTLSLGLADLDTWERPEAPSFDQGGVAMSTGIAQVEVGEWMIPGENQQELIWLLEDIKSHTRPREEGWLNTR
jgi:phage-related protein